MDKRKIDDNPFHLPDFANLGDKSNDCSTALAKDSDLSSPLDKSKKFKTFTTLEPGDTAAKETAYALDSPLAKLAPRIAAASVYVAAYDSDKDAQLAQLPGKKAVVIDSATGVVFDPRGYVIVNRHLKANLNYYARLADGQSFPLKIIYADGKADLALAKIESPQRIGPDAVIELDNAKAAENGTAVVAGGFSLEKHKLVFSLGSVALTNEDDDPGKNCGSAKQKRLLLNTASGRLNESSGQSGSAVINLKTGKMIGIVSSADGAFDKGFLWPMPLNYNSLMVRPQELANFCKQAESYISTLEKNTGK